MLQADTELHLNFHTKMSAATTFTCGGVKISDFRRGLLNIFQQVATVGGNLPGFETFSEVLKNAPFRLSEFPLSKRAIAQGNLEGLGRLTQRLSDTSGLKEPETYGNLQTTLGFANKYHQKRGLIKRTNVPFKQTPNASPSHSLLFEWPEELREGFGLQRGEHPLAVPNSVLC